MRSFCMMCSIWVYAILCLLCTNQLYIFFPPYLGGHLLLCVLCVCVYMCRYCFVQFSSYFSAFNMNGSEVKGRMVGVDWAIPKSDYQNVGTKREMSKDEEEGESSLESSLEKVTLIVRMKTDSRERAKHRKSQPSWRSQMWQKEEQFL